MLLLLAFVPLLHNSYYENLGRGILMFATLSLGWNMIGGYTGYVSFGNVVFFGLGAYTTAALWQHWHIQNIAAGVGRARSSSACSFALILGVPILRLARAIISASRRSASRSPCQEIVANLDWLGGGSGFTVRQLDTFSTYYYAMWVVCAASMLATFLDRALEARLRVRRDSRKRGSRGRARRRSDALQGHRVGDQRARWRRRPVRCFAGANGFIDGPTAFAVDDNVFPIVMTILGGVGTVAGPLVGALILTAINETLWSHFPQMHTLFFGAVIVRRRRVLAARHAVAVRLARRLARVRRLARERIAYERAFLSIENVGDAFRRSARARRRVVRRRARRGRRA